MSFGIKVGRFVGKSAALVGEGAVRGAQGLGRFGQDVATGAQEGFAEQHARNLINRAEAKAKRDAAIAAAKQAHAVAMAAPVAGPLNNAAPIKAARTAKA